MPDPVTDGGTSAAIAAGPSSATSGSITADPPGVSASTGAGSAPPRRRRDRPVVCGCSVRVAAATALTWFAAPEERFSGTGSVWISTPRPLQ